MKDKKKNILTISIIGILAIAVIILLVMFINSNKAINLTMDNYKDYFKTQISRSDKTYIDVRAVSSNFNYEDVEVKVKINGIYNNSTNEPYSEIKNVKCNISGNGNELIGNDGDIKDLAFEVLEVKGKIKPVGR